MRNRTLLDNADNGTGYARQYLTIVAEADGWITFAS